MLTIVGQSLGPLQSEHFYRRWPFAFFGLFILLYPSSWPFSWGAGSPFVGWLCCLSRQGWVFSPNQAPLTAWQKSWAGVRRLACLCRAIFLNSQRPPCFSRTLWAVHSMQRMTWLNWRRVQSASCSCRHQRWSSTSCWPSFSRFGRELLWSLSFSLHLRRSLPDWRCSSLSYRILTAVARPMGPNLLP